MVFMIARWGSWTAVRWWPKALKTKLNLKRERQAVCCAPSMQPPQRMHIASVMKQCSGYETAVIVKNPLYTLPLTSHHNNKDVFKGATL
jgi:hypothetical protein